MISALLFIVAAQLPVELHTNSTKESRLLLRAIHADCPVICEDTRLIRHYQEEIRRVVKVRQSLDTFVQVGQCKTRFPMLAYDTPAVTVLCLKREVDRFNQPRRKYNNELTDAEFTKFAGIVDLGDDGIEYAEPPWPWESNYELAAWKPPTMEK